MKRKDVALDFAAIALIVAEPLVNFSYTRGLVFETVTVALLSAHAVFALLIALLINRYPKRWFKAAVYAVLVILFLDLRVGVFDTLGIEALLVVVGCFVALWLLYVHAAKVLIAVFGVTFVLNLLEPVYPTVKDNIEARQPNERRRDSMPLYIHLVLDEFIGVEALDPEVAAQKTIKQEIQSLFVDNGFRLFGRAYSEYNLTTYTLSAGLNNYNGNNPQQFFEYDVAENENKLSVNQYFRELFDAGYNIDVVQSSFLDFCNSEAPVVSSCLTYKIGSFSGDSLAPLDSAEKFDLVLSTFWRRSFLKRLIHRLYGYTQAILGVLGLDLPHWPFISDLSTGHIQLLPIYDRLVADIASAPGGSLYFAHLLLPHHPYAFDRQCEIRRPLMNWDRPFTLEALPDGRQNTAQSRAQRYGAYVSQVRCTLAKIGELVEAMKVSGVYDDATIVIHGDHGSRIAELRPLLENRERLAPQDFYDNYSTFFAVKAPHVSPGYDVRMLPLSYLLRLAEGREPAGRDPGGEHRVYLLEHARDEPLISVPMPEIPNRAGAAPGKVN